MGRRKINRAAWLFAPAVIGLGAAACAPMPGTSITNVTDGANGESFGPSLSDDARYVVFTSEASNLTADADNGVADVLVRDLVAGTTTNLTRAGNGDSLGGVISGDGTTVAFYSDATNLTGDSDNGQSDVFTVDLASGTITNLTASGDDFSGFPAISDDGGTVAFQSYASNLTVLADTDGGAADIFGRTSGANVQLTNAGDYFGQPAISGDGLTIGFQAYGAFGGTLNEPRVVTVGAVAGTPSDAGSYAGELSLSDDGTVPAFRTFRQPDGVIQVGTTDVSDPAAASTDPSIADNGSRVGYTKGDGVFVTVVGGGTGWVFSGNGPSGEASLSGDGLVVAFTTYATDVGVPDGNGAVGDIIVKR